MSVSLNPQQGLLQVKFVTLNRALFTQLPYEVFPALKPSDSPEDFIPLMVITVAQVCVLALRAFSVGLLDCFLQS